MQDSRPPWELSGIAIYPADRVREAEPSRTGLHLAIGMFDGVHTGHQLVINSAIETAASDAGSACGVLTFDPHPSRVLHPERPTALIMSPAARVGQMLSLGLDYVFVQTFTREYARLEASAFVDLLRESFPGLKSLHVGENFRFGVGRSGTVDTLHELCRAAGLGNHVLQRKMDSGEAVSSSRIRRLLAEGETGQVGAMLGRPYVVSGKAIPGRRIGRSIGFPTLNIRWEREALPRFGVYRAWLLDLKAGKHQLAVANFGIRPTVAGDEDPLLEVHLLNPDHVPKTGDSLHVALSTFIRPEMTFSSLDALRQQIERDAEQARELDDGGLNPANFAANGIAAEAEIWKD